MKIKKFAACTVAAVCITSMAYSASANCTVDSTSGTVNWDFISYGTQYLGSIGNTSYHEFGKTELSNSSLDAVNNIKDTLIMYSKNGSGIGNSITESGIYITYRDNAKLYYTPSVPGTLSVTAYSDRNGGGISLSLDNANEEQTGKTEFTASIECSANKQIIIKPICSTNAVCLTISNITFTPTKTDAVYTFNESLSKLSNDAILNVNYTDANGTSTLTKTLNSLNAFPEVYGSGDALFAVNITDVPQTTTINKIEISK